MRDEGAVICKTPNLVQTWLDQHFGGDESCYGAAPRDLAGPAEVEVSMNGGQDFIVVLRTDDATAETTTTDAQETAQSLIVIKRDADRGACVTHLPYRFFPELELHQLKLSPTMVPCLCGPQRIKITIAQEIGDPPLGETGMMKLQLVTVPNLVRLKNPGRRGMERRISHQTQTVFEGVFTSPAQMVSEQGVKDDDGALVYTVVTDCQPLGREHCGTSAALLSLTGQEAIAVAAISIVEPADIVHVHPHVIPLTGKVPLELYTTSNPMLSPGDTVEVRLSTNFGTSATLQADVLELSVDEIEEGLECMAEQCGVPKGSKENHEEGKPRFRKKPAGPWPKMRPLRC
jgi:hypothetical protein